MQTTLMKMGNSSGVILRKDLLKKIGVEPGSKISLDVVDGKILISAVGCRKPINTDVNTWDAQFKAAFRNGDKPEKSMWGKHDDTEFDKNEWEWKEKK